MKAQSIYVTGSAMPELNGHYMRVTRATRWLLAALLAMSLLAGLGLGAYFRIAPLHWTHSVSFIAGVLWGSFVVSIASIMIGAFRLKVGQ